MKTRFVVIGTGNRGLGCFAKGLLAFPNKGFKEFLDRADLVAVVDHNLARARVAVGELAKAEHMQDRPPIPAFRTVQEAQAAAPADWAIVATPDFTHARIVIDCLELGLNVVVDKPLATSAWECDQITAVMKRTGKLVRVGHNMRYEQHALKAAQLAREGVIGDIITVEAAEVLDYNHGGDYFHRWHSDFARSAGLMTHKCCHQLDLLCWILDDQPVEVWSAGGRKFYRARPGDHGPRCCQCKVADTCPHRFSVEKWTTLYHRLFGQCEAEDGYIRDLCVFSDRHTVTDHQVTGIRFAKGTLASFAFNAFAPREFWYLHFIGTKGRMELGITSWDSAPYLRLTHADERVEEVECKQDHSEFGHGGADIQLLADIVGLPGSSPLQRATPDEARRAVLIADLSSRSLAAGGKPVTPAAAGRDYPPAPPQ